MFIKPCVHVHSLATYLLLKKVASRLMTCPAVFVYILEFCMNEFNDLQVVKDGRKFHFHHYKIAVQ